MKSASTGLPAGSRSRAAKLRKKQGGFTLLEALVALALVLAFAEVLGPYLFHARKIMFNAADRVAAQVLLRSLLDAPFDRSQLTNVSRRGETAGLHWHIATEPMAAGGVPSGGPWTAFRVTADVSTGNGSIITAETVRLARSE
jgi:hypothetical protein